MRVIFLLLLATSIAWPRELARGKLARDELPAASKKDDPVPVAIYAPRSWDGKTPAPLIFAIHAGTKDGAQFARFLRPIAEAQKAIIVAPTAFREVVGADGFWWKGDKAEMKLLSRTLAYAHKELPIDKTRATLVGLADGAELGLRWALSRDRGFEGAIALNFLWKLKGTPKAKSLKVVLIASEKAMEETKSLSAHARKAHAALLKKKQPVVLRVVPGSSRSFFHGWEREFAHAHEWFVGKRDWPAQLAESDKARAPGK